MAKTVKEVVAHAYANTKEQLNEIITLLESNGYETAFETEYMTNVSIIKEVTIDDEQAD